MPVLFAFRGPGLFLMYIYEPSSNLSKSNSEGVVRCKMPAS